MSESTTEPSPVFQRLDRSTPYPYTRREYVRRLCWSAVQATLFRWSLPRAYRWRRWLLRCFGAEMAVNSGVQRLVRVFHPWLLRMEEWSLLSNGVVVYNLGPVSIGRHTVISQEAWLCAGTHDHTRSDLPLLRPPIQIGSGVWIAAQAFIGPDVTIGDNSVVGARAVVFSDVPAGVIVAGNPAQVIKQRTMNAQAAD